MLPSPSSHPSALLPWISPDSVRGLNEIVSDGVRVQEALVGEQVIWEYRGDLSQLFEDLRGCVKGFQAGYPKAEAADLVCLRGIKLSHTSSPHRGFHGPGSWSGKTLSSMWDAAHLVWASVMVH